MLGPSCLDGAPAAAESGVSASKVAINAGISGHVGAGRRRPNLQAPEPVVAVVVVAPVETVFGQVQQQECSRGEGLQCLDHLIVWARSVP